MPRPAHYARIVCLLTAWLLLSITSCCADARYNWDALLNTRRIAILAPFFCTVKPPAQSSPAHTVAKPKTKSGVPVPAADTTFHAQTLQSLTSTLQTALPESIAAASVYQVVSEAEVGRALRALHWQPRDLFAHRGEPVSGKFPTPNIPHIQKLAQHLHVDGIVVAAMREPASIGDGIRLPYALWMVNPLDLSIRRMRAHVLSPRVKAFLITAQGEIAWQDEQCADHPRTTPHTLKTLLVDWQEATEQVAQQLADSLHRRPPG